MSTIRNLIRIVVPCLGLGFGVSAYGGNGPLWEVRDLTPAAEVAELDQWTSAPVARDGVGGCMAVWVAETTAPSSAILAAFSPDDGETWPVRKVISDVATSGTAGATDPVVATDGQGRWLALWSASHGQGGSGGWDRDIVVSRSADGGATWSPPALLNSNGTSDIGMDMTPWLAADGAGNWVAFWTSENASLDGSTTGPLRVWSCRSSDDGVSWSASELLAAAGAGEEQRSPRVYATGAGRFASLWTRLRTSPASNAIVMRSSMDGGVNWAPSPTPNLTAGNRLPPGADFAPVLAVDNTSASPRWVLAWQAGPDSTTTSPLRIWTCRSANGGQSWTQPGTVLPQLPLTAAPQNFPTLTVDRQGTWVCGWSTRYNFGVAALYAASTDGGVTWSGQEPISGELTFLASVGPQESSPVFCPKLSGDWGCLFGTRAGTYVNRRMRFGNTRICIRPQVDSRWSPPAPFPDGSASPLTPGYSPRIASGGSGRWVAAFVRNSGAGSAVHVARSHDHGHTWTIPTPIDPPNSGGQVIENTPDVASDGEGRLMCVWSRAQPPGGVQQICYSVSLDEGATWTLPGVLAGTDGISAGSHPQLAHAGGSVWLLTWQASTGIQFRRSTDGGQTWSVTAKLKQNNSTPPTNSGSSSESYSAPSLHVGPGGTALLAYSYYNYARYNYVYESSGWGQSALLTSNAGESWGASAAPGRAATDGTGVWIAAVSRKITRSVPPFTEGYRMSVARSVDGGLSYPGSFEFFPHQNREDVDPWLATDQCGTWCLMWRAGGRTISGTWGANLTSWSADNGQTWSSPQQWQGIVPGVTTWSESPQIVADHSGHWVAIWSAASSGSGMANTVWYSTAQTAVPSSVADWQLFD